MHGARVTIIAWEGVHVAKQVAIAFDVIVPQWGSHCDAAVCVHMHTGRQDKGVELTYMPWRYLNPHILLIIESCWAPYAPFRVCAGPWLCWRAMQGWRRCFWRHCGA